MLHSHSGMKLDKSLEWAIYRHQFSNISSVLYDACLNYVVLIFAVVCDDRAEGICANSFWRD